MLTRKKTSKKIVSWGRITRYLPLPCKRIFFIIKFKADIMTLETIILSQDGGMIERSVFTFVFNLVNILLPLYFISYKVSRDSLVNSNLLRYFEDIN